MQVVNNGFIHLPDWPTLADFVRVQLSRPFSSALLRWEWALLSLGLLVLTNPFIVPDRWFLACAVRLHRYAQRPWRAIWTCTLLPIVVRVLLLPAAPLKPPSVHDEFSLLLLADTLRSFRLTNKAHILWPHFETIHVIQQPTYSSMYPPGSGVFMAIGMLLGHPWIGVLFGMGILCGAICWMLQAWVSPTWAFAATVLAVAQIGIGSYWMNSYIGAPQLPAIAGALLLGVIPRFVKQPTKGLAIVFSAGVIALENTRPYEGTMLVIACVLLTLHWHRRSPSGGPVASWEILRPAAAILILGAIFTLYDCWRVTGSPVQTGYLVNRRTYGWPENLAYLPPARVSFRHSNLANMYGVEVSMRARYNTLGRIVNNWFARWTINWEFFLGPGLTIPMLLLPWALRDDKLRQAFYILAGLMVLNLLQFMAYPQHFSPVVSLIYLLVAAGLRELWLRTPRQHAFGARLCAALLVCITVGAGLSLLREPLGIVPSGFWEWPHTRYFRDRAAVEAKVESFPGKHLVLIRYGADHFAQEEWVYNAANIDRSRVVWANSMGPDADKDLRTYFHDRQFWLVEPDRDPGALLPLTSITYPGW